MSEKAPSAIQLVLPGLRLLYGLYRTLDRALLKQALSRKVPLPPVSRVLSWDETEALILANPDLLSSERLRGWWQRRGEVDCRARLMVGLARQLRRRPGEDFFLFAPEIRADDSLVVAILSASGRHRRILSDDGLSREEKARQLVVLLEEVIR